MPKPKDLTDVLIKFNMFPFRHPNSLFRFLFVYAQFRPTLLEFIPFLFLVPVTVCSSNPIKIIINIDKYLCNIYKINSKTLCNKS